jgi:squalene cyclase
MLVVISADILMALQIYQRSGRARPWHAALRRTVLTSTLRDRQREGEFAGSWLEFPLVTINILACLLDLGYSRNEPLVRDGLDWLERWRTPEGGLGQVVAFNIWETCLSALLLQRIDRPGLQEKIKKAVRFLAASQREDGASTWDSRLGKSSYADFDSTSYSALVRARSGEPINLGQVNTLLLKQLKNGGCGMFGRESLVPIHPYLKSCLDATCHVNNYLVFTFGRDSVPVRASVRWIMRNQNKDGSWTGVWYMRKTYGIDCALESLVLAGIPPDHPSIQAGCGWLKRAQNSDGGWGEDWCGQPHQSTVEQTAYAVHALAVAGEEISSAVLQRAITYLLKHQQPDGHWPAAQVGTFFHRMSGTYNTPSYPDIVALHALAAVQSVAAQSPR